MKRILFILTTLLPLYLPAQTIEQVERELIKQNVPHHKIVLAQARLETGNFTSKRCRVHHNLFGIKHNGRYARYTTWKDSIKDYKERISSRYTNGDYYTFLKRIGYAKDPKYIYKLKQF
jgi:flagellum-specific peptidoglycan hydrolase FlgJ